VFVSVGPISFEKTNVTTSGPSDIEVDDDCMGMGSSYPPFHEFEVQAQDSYGNLRDVGIIAMNGNPADLGFPLNDTGALCMSLTSLCNQLTLSLEN
jgi:hypothetical protein